MKIFFVLSLTKTLGWTDRKIALQLLNILMQSTGIYLTIIYAFGYKVREPICLSFCIISFFTKLVFDLQIERSQFQTCCFDSICWTSILVNKINTAKQTVELKYLKCHITYVWHNIHNYMAFSLVVLLSIILYRGLGHFTLKA